MPNEATTDEQDLMLSERDKDLWTCAGVFFFRLSGRRAKTEVITWSMFSIFYSLLVFDSRPSRSPNL